MLRQTSVAISGNDAKDIVPYPRPGDEEREEAKQAEVQSQFERWQARQAAREAG